MAEAMKVTFNNSKGGHWCKYPGCRASMVGVDDLPPKAVVTISQGRWAMVDGKLLCEWHKGKPNS